MFSNTPPRSRLRAAAALTGIAAAAVSSLFLAAPAEAHVHGGNVGVAWSIPGVPESGVAEITFPLTVHANAARENGIYYAQQFAFTDTPDGGYTGLQPRPSVDGRDRLRGVFSSFIAGSRSTDKNCSDGADGGAGVSCGVEFDAVYGHPYDLVVKKGAGNTWTGTALDTVTKKSVRLGSWTIPTNGLLKGSHGGFVEYYAGVTRCDDAPRVDVTFGGPVASGGLAGTSTSNGEYSNCVGQAGYGEVTVDRGVRITRGAVRGPFSTSPLQTAGGLCLDVPGGNFTDGVRPILWSCTGGQNQRWTATSALQLISGDICIDTQIPDAGEKTGLVLMNCSGKRPQQWELVNGTIRHVTARLCVQPTGGTSQSGATLELAKCNGSEAQKFTRQGLSPKASAKQSSTPTIAAGSTGAAVLTVVAGAKAAEAKAVLTAPSGTTFTGKARFFNGSSGADFDGKLSADKRTLTLSLSMIPGLGLADTLQPNARAEFTAELAATKRYAAKSFVTDGSWKVAGMTGRLGYTAK